jgi:hypothetical protein
MFFPLNPDKQVIKINRNMNTKTIAEIIPVSLNTMNNCSLDY